MVCTREETVRPTYICVSNTRQHAKRGPNVIDDGAGCADDRGDQSVVLQHRVQRCRGENFWLRGD